MILSKLEELGSMQGKGRRTTNRVIVVEDDSALVEALTFNLEKEGYDVTSVSDGREALRIIKQDPPDLVVLDLMLPGINGIEICKQLRADKATSTIPVLMLTAKSEESDQLVGFSVGADDYVTKPFSVKVLLQRVRVLLQRHSVPAESGDTLERHGIMLDRVGHQVYCDAKPVPLTRTEFRLLESLMNQPGRAFTRNDLLSSAIGDETIVLERTIDVHIRSLRQKLEKHAAAIETVRGVGYRFARDRIGESDE